MGTAQQRSCLHRLRRDRERNFAEVGARGRDHHLAQQGVGQGLVAHDRDGFALGLVLGADYDALGLQIETGTVFMNRCDYLDPALTWTGVKDTGRGTSLSYLGFHAVTRAKSYHLRKALK